MQYATQCLSVVNNVLNLHNLLLYMDRIYIYVLDPGEDHQLTAVLINSNTYLLGDRGKPRTYVYTAAAVIYS